MLSPWQKRRRVRASEKPGALSAAAPTSVATGILATAPARGHSELLARALVPVNAVMQLEEVTVVG